MKNPEALYLSKKKSSLTARFFLLLFGSHYIYLGKIVDQLVLWAFQLFVVYSQGVLFFSSELTDLKLYIWLAGIVAGLITFLWLLIDFLGMDGKVNKINAKILEELTERSQKLNKFIS